MAYKSYTPRKLDAKRKSILIKKKMFERRLSSNVSIDDNGFLCINANKQNIKPLKGIVPTKLLTSPKIRNYNYGSTLDEDLLKKAVKVVVRAAV